MLNARRIWIMTGLAIAAVWLIDAAVDALIFGKESLAEQLSAPDGHELYIRLLASSFVALTGVVWGFHARRLETTRNRLAASEANAAALVAAFPDCVVVHRGGRPLFANEAALAFLGRTDLPGLALLGVDDVIHPDDRADVLSYLASLRSGANDFVPREMRMRRGDGVYATAMVRSRLLRYEGSPAILTVFRDITAEVETRRDLVVSRERLSLALEAAQDGVWDWDIPSGRMVYSRSWATMLGLQLEDVTPDQKTWESLIHPDDHRRAMALLHAHLQGEVPIYETEVRLRHARGHYIWVLDRGKVVRRNAAGEPLRMTGTHRDITDRKEAELALEVRNRLAAAFLTGSGPEIYRSVLALVSDALGSPAGLLATVEREGALRLVAARPYTEVGRIAADRLPPMLARVTRHNHAVIEEGLVDLDGSGHTVRGAVGVPISTRDQVLGVLVVADRSDVYRVSDRAFLESLAGYLAPILQSHQANARTELQLRQAQKMEALGALAGGIAHDFNNILQAILGFTSLARGDAEDGSNLARDLDRVLKAARRGEELVRRILLFSRREEREARPADVGAMVQEAVDLLRPTLPSTIELRVAIEPGVGRIVADPAQIGQMLLNLATNALHAMERDGGAMTIRAERLVRPTTLDLPPALAGQDLVCVTVADDGCGMDQATLGRLFDPFFTTKAVGKGTGLGLSVVHGIVTTHGGHIAVDSIPGRGTTVTVVLPRLADDPAAATIDTGGDRTSVLFVDDEEPIVAVGVAMLRRVGMTCEGCIGGAAALDRLSGSPDHYDILVTDAAMPGVGGDAVVARWRAVRPGAPVIVVTGHEDSPLVGEAGSSGPALLLRKPFTHDTLVGAVRDGLAASRGPGV